MDEGPHVVIGAVSMVIPYSMTKKEEKAIRKKMRHPGAKGDFGYIEYVEVVESWRGKGIGTKMLKRAILKAIGEFWIIALSLKVDYENLPAIKVYEKLGFKKILSKLRLPAEHWIVFL
ncbi:conserved hypothetical protein [Perkinsus marinus ATCC 50983]|uniref:N-acetyltransferase domain-containing protein n=1 Tax=Perkinsus marinus (strain ATCC 50983 / TXsc) TaxID=423536 RepID=C5KDP9_PERM5|nr:conserved hypothetical protein [Perkinsus marinus ATCC 50983]EER17352.1 conserved hypothetical protein [Perkinsus marinus ATCC 50983]|eukprot:XP_002785556.1 conserved hypothetical protein [Perkinsus marinus ATCC 50983]